MVGEFAGRLALDGSLERTLIVVASDHGHIPVAPGQHVDLVPWLEAQGQRTLTYPFRFRRWFDSDAACFKCGDAMALIYLKGGGWHRPLDPDHPQVRTVADGLLQLPAVDVIAYRETGGWVRVRSRRGNARVKISGDEVRYAVGPGIDDPFGYQAIPETLSQRDLLLRTQDTAYPDAPLQMAQLFESARCGDIIVSATPGWDFGKQGTTHGTSVSGHGSLHATHLRVPFLMNRPFDTTAVRTVDVAPTILELMGQQPGPACDGVSLVRERTGSGTRAVPDGVRRP
jgi:arylsulfatase A-like enzyme